MVQRGSGTSLALESRNAIGIRAEILPQYLDRDDPPEPFLVGAVDLAHAAGAERLEDLIRSETCAGA